MPHSWRNACAPSTPSTIQATTKTSPKSCANSLVASVNCAQSFSRKAIQGVLQTPKQQLKLPVATAYPLDNIQKCRHLLPESDANRQTLVARPKKASPSAAETKAASVKKAPASATLSLFDQLADTYLDGPFRVLRHCFLERMRVFVVIRRINSVRGTCSGFLKAFDKHMNLVLLDVTQEFISLNTHERLLRERIGGAIAEYLLVLVELDASPSPAFKRMENGDGAKLQQHPPTEDASERA
ncbi:hypothetical protein PC123_g10889 [Phytophthora cactorum]|nr:hypothetical protein PC123_g10889 [Phytophthora cactorum]